MAAQAGGTGKGENIRIVFFGKAIVAGGFLSASLNIFPTPLGKLNCQIACLAAAELTQCGSLGRQDIRRRPPVNPVLQIGFHIWPGGHQRPAFVLCLCPVGQNAALFHIGFKRAVGEDTGGGMGSFRLFCFVSVFIQCGVGLAGLPAPAVPYISVSFYTSQKRRTSPFVFGRQVDEIF